MVRRDPERTRRLRIAVRYLLEKGEMAPGSQSQLARHFNVSRQRVHQIVVEERELMALGRPVGGGNGGGQDAGSALEARSL